MPNNTPVLVFLGTPAFAVPTLERLHQSKQFSVPLIITQPDQPAGRGRKLTPSPVKNFAVQHQVQLLQPPSIKTFCLEHSDGKPQFRTKSDPPFVEALNALPLVDAFICVAYGNIIPKSFMEFARYGVINIHPSLLPRWRGAAPIQQAIFAGDKTTGVSIMQIDEGLDTGPVYAMQTCPITAKDTSGSLHDKLSHLGADLLLSVLPDILLGNKVPQAQDEAGVTYAEKWDKDDLAIRWEESAEVTVQRIRASTPHPGARALFQGSLVIIHQAHIVSSPIVSSPLSNSRQGYPGEIVECNRKELVVFAGASQYIALDVLQFPGKKPLAISEILKGHQFPVGARFEKK